MKKQSIVIALTGVAIIALLVALPVFFDESKPDRHTAAIPAPQKLDTQKAKPDFALMFSAKNGEVMSYHFALASDAKLSSAMFSNAGQSPSTTANEFVKLNTQTTGDLFLKFFDPVKPGEELNLYGFIEQLSYTLNGQTPDYAKEMAYPFTVQMDDKGYLKHFSFAQGMSEQAQIMIRTLLYSMQTVYPKQKDNKSWKTREIDSTGQYQAEYRIADAGNQDLTIEKSKQAYLLLLNENDRMAEGLVPTAVQIEKSQIKTRLPAHGAWIESTDQSETTALMNGTKNLGQVNMTFSAIRQAKAPTSTMVNTFAEAMVALNSSARIKQKYSATDANLNKVSASLNLDDALARYLTMRESKTSAERLNAEKFMVNYLRLNPQACYDLIQLMDKDPKKEKFSHAAQLELWQFITKAGHEDAQRAVLDAATKSDFSELTHMRALAYVHDFEYPEAFLVDGLWGLYHKVDMASGNDKTREKGAMSLYAIGDLGSEEKLNDAIKPEVGQSLVENLNSSQNEDVQTVTLQAIGNYGGTDVINDIQPYFASQSERVRVSAYEAIRRMESAKAFQSFVDNYSRETSPKVRTSALKIIESMPATQDSISWAGNEVLKVAESDDQEALAKLLGKNIKEYPQAEESLRELLKQKPSNNVKREVYRYIKPN